MKTSLRVKGPGLAKLQTLARQLSERPHVKVGVLQNSKGGGATSTSKTKKGSTSKSSSKTINRGGGELTNADLMAIHEFGAPRAGIPARSVLRATADAQRAKWMAMLERVVRGAVAGKVDLLTALDLVGLKATADMVAAVRKGIAPPLKSATIKAKGSSKPLIDTGRLVMSLGHEVVRSSG